ncbi:MAG TPA: hypothetical protein VNI55_08675 [Gaiellaceae bacterium]|nr:hypothetical protein [Gaiellaceae bacterium]
MSRIVDGRRSLLLGREELKRIGGDLDGFGAALDEQRTATGLDWPA